MRKPWSAFESVISTSSVHGAREVSPQELVAISEYKRDVRIAACGGVDPISICLAYAQDRLIYDASGHMVEVDAVTYEATPRSQRVNVFARAYRPDAVLWLHQTLADILVATAIHLYQRQGWRLVVFDGLRTVEGTFKLYEAATDEDLSAGLLALPGRSAHNKGLAVDSMCVDRSGIDIEMGGHFDHLDMTTNMRHYQGDKISEQAKQNRLIREAAFLRAAFSQGKLIAPLRSEFWDDRLPENRADLWRVLDSVARVIGIRLEIDKSWEQWSYADFCESWKRIFAGHEAMLLEAIGVISPPDVERPEWYHGNYHPIYDRNLRLFGKHLTD